LNALSSCGALAVSARHDRFGERIDDEPLPLAVNGLPLPPPRANRARAGVVAPQPLCQLCTRPLQPTNVSGVCAECRLVVRNRLGVAIEERWRDHPDGEHVVSDRGRIARLLHVDGAPGSLRFQAPAPRSHSSPFVPPTEEAREYARAPRIRQGNYPTLTKAI
jgi:hypothetical protein